jgi:hypothetical protein
MQNQPSLLLRRMDFMRRFSFLLKGHSAMNAITTAMLDNATLTPREVQFILRASRSSVYRGLNSGTILSFRINKTVLTTEPGKSTKQRLQRMTHGTGTKGQTKPRPKGGIEAGLSWRRYQRQLRRRLEGA